ncbi:MAG: tRNA (adenosine(37)-N6)-threonylcarbamoyltransferase complex ATPase subunit type 1 TsaE [Candidatus Eremiobacteraeota bacterium]|nr:tRNA (adenosine(37)-N6)-threonylcarbamoyltransferase complex ATPase subunit type 1 TsaE [Candidatus Eremiobacteraeota bacterium]
MTESSLQILTKSPGETAKIGETLAGLLSGGEIIGFSGDLGTGKTVCIQGICRGLGVRQKVTSSSFVIMRSLAGRIAVNHFDLYRLEDPEELIDLGYEEFLFSDSVALVEWAERLGRLMGEEYLMVTLEYGEENDEERLITLTASGERYERLIGELRLQNIGKEWQP